MKPTTFYVTLGMCAVKVRVSQADLDAAVNPNAMLGAKVALALETARQRLAEEHGKRRQAAEQRQALGIID